MLLRASDQHHQPPTGSAAGETAKWQSFSIRSVLGDALNDNDDDEEEEEDAGDDLDVVIDAGGRPAGVDGATSPPGGGSCATGSSPGSCSDGRCDDDASRIDHHGDHHRDDQVDRVADSLSSQRCGDELRDFSRWTAFQTASNVIVTSSHHHRSQYANHGTAPVHYVFDDQILTELYTV